MQLSGFHCLACVVLNCRGIKREHLFLLQSKQLNEYLSNKNISTVSCKEKYDLVDLIMEYAKTNNILSAEDRAHQSVHDNHLRNLQRAAEDMKKEDNANQNNQTDGGEEGTSHQHSDTLSNGSSASSSQHVSPGHSQHMQQQQQHSHNTETSEFQFFNSNTSNENTQQNQHQQQQEQQPHLPPQQPEPSEQQPEPPQQPHLPPQQPEPPQQQQQPVCILKVTKPI